MGVPTEFKIAFAVMLVLDAAVIGLSAYAGAPATQDRVYSDGLGPIYPIMLLIAVFTSLSLVLPVFEFDRLIQGHLVHRLRFRSSIPLQLGYSNLILKLTSFGSC